MTWVLVALSMAVGGLAGWRGSRVRIVVVSGLLVAWSAALVLLQTDYRNASGFMDCWPRCTTLQHAVGLAFFWSPVMLVCVLIGALGSRLANRHGR